MKYRPDYPYRFGSIQDARRFCQDFFALYNHRHHHSGLSLTEDQIIRQVLQGGGNMPAYGKAPNPAETKALTSFLITLRGPLAPARDSSMGLDRAGLTQ